ncbi:MAG: hypothetical protein KBD50_01805 [Candidatus Pacebacteria bacterium]|nr:hypothetical protein [Candidatus Paceibacterota bacterium]
MPISLTPNKDILGGEDDDLIKGKAGADHLDGAAGNDQIYGGDGTDTLYGGEDDDYLKGGKGDDILYGGDGMDTLHGSAGKDKLYAGAGDHVGGGKGADTFYFDEDLIGGTATIGDFTLQDKIDFSDVSGLTIGRFSVVPGGWDIDLDLDGTADAHLQGISISPQEAYDTGVLIL